MSAGNTLVEAQVQCLSEIFERAVKREILEAEIALPDVPREVLTKYPGILAGIQSLEEQGFPVLVKDASLGGPYPVMCVTLMNPRTGGVLASLDRKSAVRGKSVSVRLECDGRRIYKKKNKQESTIEQV